MIEVEIGKIYITETLKEKIEEHKQMMINANPDKAEMIENSTFGMVFSDWLMKNAGNL